MKFGDTGMGVGAGDGGATQPLVSLVIVEFWLLIVPSKKICCSAVLPLPEADAVMMLRVQRERMNASFFPSEREYSRRFGLDLRRMSLLPEHAIVMHPGPMNRGMEIAAEVADAKRSVIVEQVANGVSVRMAVLYLLLGGGRVVDGE